MKKLLPSLLKSVLFGLILFVNLFSEKVFAQLPPYYKTGTGTANSFPFASTTSNKVQWVYYPSNFPLANKRGKITKIYFKTSSAVLTPFVYTNLQVRMGYTTLTSFTTGPYVATGLTTCLNAASYSIQGTGAGNWVEISLTTPFIYDPSQNFIVEVSQTAYNQGFSVNQVADPGNRRLYGAVSSSTGTAGAGGLADFGFDLQSVSFNDAGIARIDSPITFCSNSTQNIYATVRNMGANQITSVNINWSVDGVLRPVIPYTTLLDTSGGLGSNTGLVNLGTVSFPSSSGKLIKVWTSLPNNVIDTVAVNDSSIKTLKPSLSGTFTIGTAPGRSYPSLAAAAADLNAFGVCGPVVFNLDTGTYIGKVNIQNVLGVNATNTIRINGKGARLLHTSDANDLTNYVLQIRGTNYVRVDSLTIELAAASTKGSPISIGEANYCTIKNCKLIGDVLNTGSTYGGLTFSGSATSPTTATIARFNTIEDNEIIGGYYGVTFVGTTATTNVNGNIFRRNKVRDFYLYGIYNAAADSTQIISNEIYRTTRVGSTTYSIYIATNSQYLNISKNSIHDLIGISTTQTAGIYFTSSDAAVGKEALVSNNVMYNFGTSGTNYGIYNSGSDGMNLYNNSISLDLASATAGIGYGIYQITAAVRIDIKNNNISINKGGSGAKYCLYFATNTSTITSNNNNLYMNTAASGAGVKNIGYWGAGFITLTDWKAANSSAFDQASVSADPLFASSSILRPNSATINDMGTSLTLVTDDITGALRSSSPDPGAYEFTPANDDAGISALLSPSGICPGTATVKVRVKNYGISTLTSVSVNWSLNNVLQTGISFVGSLNSTADTALTVGTFTAAANTNYNIKVWTSNPNNNADANAINDTVKLNNLKTGLLGTVTVGGVGATFASLTAMATELNSNGICGSVIINVNPAAGPYTTGFTLQNIKGLSSTSTLTINGNGSVINTISNGIVLNKVNYVTIDSFNVNVNGTAGFGIHIFEGDYNTIRKNTVIIPQDNTSTAMSAMTLSGSTTSATTAGRFRYNTIEKNVFRGGYYLMSLSGNSTDLTSAVGNTVRNNRLLDAYVYSVYSVGTDSLIFENNDINRATRTTSISTFYGSFFTTGTRNLRYRNNKIHTPFSQGYVGTGTAYMLYTSADAIVGNENIHYNNAIYNIGGSGLVYGIYSVGSDGSWYYNNTIDIGGTGAGTVYAAIQTTAATNVEFKNNSFNINRTSGTGTRILLNLATNTSTVVSNNNHFNGNGGVIYGQWGTLQGANLAAWKAVNSSVFDQNSISGDPLFNGVKNVIPKQGSPLVGTGSPLPIVAKDLLGATRSVTTPTIGAYENAGDYSGPTITFAPILNTLSTSNYTLTNFATITDPAGVDTSLARRPRMYYKLSTNTNTYVDNTSLTDGWKYVTATNTSSPFSFVIDYSKLNTTVSTGSIIQYFVVGQDLTSASSINAPLQFTLDPSNVNLSAANFPILGTLDQYRVASAISGTFFVGTAETYKSLTGASSIFEYINNNILSGNIDIVVKTNLVETGAFALNAFAETGVGNYSISIKPSADTLRILSGSYVGGLIRLNGADRVIFDGRFNSTGKFLRIENSTATSGSAAVQLISLGVNAGAKSNTIRNMVLVAGSAGNAIGLHIGGAGIPYSEGANNDNNKIIENQFIRGSVGIFNAGTATLPTDSLLIEKNSIGSSLVAEQFRLYGIAVDEGKNTIIKNNQIQNIINTAAQQAWGIAVYGAFTNGQILNNKIERVSSGGGAFGGRGIEVITGKPNENITIANNFIGGITGTGATNLNSTSIVGISLQQTGGVKIYNNSINLTGSISRATTVPDTSAGIHFGIGSRLMNVRNNSIVNNLNNASDTAFAYSFYSAVGDTAFTDFNYNNYYVAGTNQAIFGRFPGADLNSMALVQVATGKNSNSISKNPNYISLTDLHAQGANMFQKGTSIATVLDDIDGQARPGTPSIGADEYTPSTNELELTEFIYPNGNPCGINSDSLRVVISNLGISSQTGFNVKATLTGAATATLNKLYTKTLIAGARDTVSLGYYNSNLTGVVNFTVFTELASDALKNNDTIRVSRTFAPTPAMPTLVSISAACKGSPATLVVSASSPVIRWYNAAVGGNLLTTNDTLITSPISVPTKFYASTSNGSSSGALKITEIDIGGTDKIEIQNLSGGAINTAGYKVIVSDSYTLINATNTFVWSLPATMGAGQILYKTDGTTDNYWGSNLFWNPGAYPSFTGWAMILDNNNVVVDALFMNWPAASIASAAIVYNTTPIIIGPQWTGDGVDITTVAATNSVSRGGNSDNNKKSDFQIVPLSNNATNSILVIPFITDGCTSDRLEVLVTPTPLPSGATVSKSTPFTGVYNAGTLASPDAACVGDTMTYLLTPPTGFNAIDLGVTWAVLNPVVKTIGGTIPTGVITTNGLSLQYRAAVGDLDSTLLFTATIKNISTGCDSFISRYLKIYATPVVNLGTDRSICTGTTTSLNAGNAGASYLWSTGATTQSIQVGTAGTYTVKVTNASGCDMTDEVVITTIQSPIASLGPDLKVCVGDTATLDAGNPGATYLWSTGASTQTIRTSVAGIYTVTVSNGNCTVADTILFGFNALPVVSLGIDRSICTSDTITLDAGNAGSTYLWSTGATSKTIRVSTLGTYSVQVTNVNGCIASDEIIITNKAEPLADITSSVLAGNGLSIQFNVTTAPAQTYSWNFGDPSSASNISALSNPVHTFTDTGSFVVSLTVTNVATGCKKTTMDTVNVKLVGVGSANAELFKFHAAPNPFAGSTKICYNLPANANVTLEVYDMIGRKVNTIANSEYQNAGKHEVSFTNTDNQNASGVYMIRLIVDGKVAILRVIDIANR